MYVNVYTLISKKCIISIIITLIISTKLWIKVHKSNILCIHCLKMGGLKQINANI